jgi:methylenetetrahydrofolate dehydrogenase (NADP+) / methenyltetrahydrofolate cyclohydrolase
MLSFMVVLLLTRRDIRGSRRASQERTGANQGPGALVYSSHRRGPCRYLWQRRLTFIHIGVITVTTAIDTETKLMRGSALAKRLRAEIMSAKEMYRSLSGRDPILATLLVGRDPAALAYRASIDRTFKKVGIEHRYVEEDASISNERLVDVMDELNEDSDITGVLVLMPLPDHLDPHVILEHLSPLKDVDGITPVNAGRLHLGLPSLRPSTPAGGIELLDYFGIDLDGADVTVIGRSNVVGRPLATLLSHRHATVTLCHTHTRDLAEKTRRADVVCVAAGSAGLVTGDMVSPGAIVLDFGVNVNDDGKIVGDADPSSLDGVAAAITPVPGGTGPVTALVLARNVLAAGFASHGGTLDALPELSDALKTVRNEYPGEDIA